MFRSWRECNLEGLEVGIKWKAHLEQRCRQGSTGMDDVVVLSLEERRMSQQLELVTRVLLNSRILGAAVSAVILLPPRPGLEVSTWFGRFFLKRRDGDAGHIESETWAVVDELLSHLPTILSEFDIVADISLVTESQQAYSEAVDRNLSPLYWLRRTVVEFVGDASVGGFDLVYDFTNSSVATCEVLARIVSDNGILVFSDNDKSDRAKEDSGELLENIGCSAFRRLPSV